MIKKTITVEGRDVTLASSGYLPFFYREKIGRDLVKDMSRLMAGYKKLMAIPEDAPEEERMAAQLDIVDLQTFADVAWIMQKYAGEDVGNSTREWLESLDGAFTIIQVMPTVQELWNITNKTTAVPAKK